ncbi:hypothetical protein [Lysinibacillus telephonicus]|uniref:hypothetical protein n=1 Tax=Lysinibacillus telephonicus TaxID=1714840 RepID=UPI0037D76262
MYDKESVYDERISPLMAQIIEICKEEGIPFASQFYLKQEREDADSANEAMWCTTVLNIFDIHPEHKEQLSYVAEAMRWGKNGRPFIMAATIFKS